MENQQLIQKFQIAVRNMPTNCNKLFDRIHEFARKHLQMSSDNMKRRCDRQAHQLNLEISGTVWLYNPKRTRGVCKQNERVLIQYLKS